MSNRCPVPHPRVPQPCAACRSMRAESEKIPSISFFWIFGVGWNFFAEHHFFNVARCFAGKSFVHFTRAVARNRVGRVDGHDFTNLIFPVFLLTNCMHESDPMDLIFLPGMIFFEISQNQPFLRQSDEGLTENRILCVYRSFLGGVSILI